MGHFSLAEAPVPTQDKDDADAVEGVRYNES